MIIAQVTIVKRVKLSNCLHVGHVTALSSVITPVIGFFINFSILKNIVLDFNRF